MVNMALFGSVWISVGQYGLVWFQRISKEIFLLIFLSGFCGLGSVWVSVAWCGSVWLSVGQCGSVWLSVAHCGSLLVGVYGLIWLGVGQFGSVWVSVGGCIWSIMAWCGSVLVWCVSVIVNENNIL